MGRQTNEKEENEDDIKHRFVTIYVMRMLRRNN